jgi:CheY-like chemotaxis protein
VATILRGARNAADLTQKLLTFSRKRRLAREPVDLHAVIEAAIGLLDRSLDRRIDIQTRLAAERSHVVGDASQLQNVFLNLALNARDAMPEGGTLTFATTACPPPGSGAQDTGAGPPADWLAATVSDTGVGMPPEMVERVLEPFFTTKPLGEGTGLGLATVYGAVEEHGGTVSIDSEPGRGTTVRILLPGARGADLAAEPPPVEEVRGSGRVLVVDDDELVRSMAGAQLRGLGYEVVAARSGAEAVTLLARDPDAFDAVLLDLIMPGLDGQATFARLRDLRADLPVVFSSGYDPDQAMDDLIAQGGVGFVAKPYRRSELARALAAAMDPTTRRPGSG